jgi:pimeloyl-ACP methyl ester carboxylesterase
MKKHLLRRSLLILGSLTGFALLAVLIVPLFISAEPLENLSTAESAATERSRFVTIPFEGTDGIKIHYLESGSDGEEGPVFVLLHGSLYNSFSWDKVIDDLGEKGRTIAYDQIPYGLSEKLTQGEWTGPNPYETESALKQLQSFLDAMDLDRVYLVGSSFGGTLAVQAALEYPSRISGLILVDPAVFVDESMPPWLVKSPQMDHIGPLMARSMASGTSFYEKCYADPFFFSGKRKEETVIMTKIRDWDFALWQYLKAWGEGSVDYRSRIPDIHIPVLIVAGEKDAIVAPEDARELNNMLPDSTLRYIPDTGHMPHEESPEKFLGIVLPWISKTTVQAGSL